MNNIDKFYRDAVLRSEYREKYALKQRGKIDRNTPWWDNSQTGGSMDFCENILRNMRLYGAEAHLVFTKENKNFLHAAVVYRDPDDKKWYIADPITDIKRFTGMVPEYQYHREQGEEFYKKKSLIDESDNKKIDVDEYIKQFGNISLYNINVEKQDENVSNYNELEEALKEATKYDEFGFNKYKIHTNGTFYDDNGFDYRGLNRRGFNKEGIHYKTNKPYDERGLNVSGHFDYDEEGYNINGFNKYQRHRNGTFYDDDGFDYKGLNRRGFNREGIHYKTSAPYNEKGYRQNGEYYYDEEGYDHKGYNEVGYDRDGYNKEGFNANGIHRNGTEYNDEGYNIEGYDKKGYNRNGYNKEGINKDTGEKDPRITLIEEFINSNTSRKKFSAYKGINLDDFNKIIKEVLSEYPNADIKQEDIDKEAKKSSAVYLAKRENIVRKLLSGEITFDEYCSNNNGIKVQDLLKKVEGTKNEEAMYKILGNGLTSQKRDMMDYIRVFAKGKYDNTVYQKTIQEFIKFEKGLARHKNLLDIYRKLRSEEKRLQIYKSQFRRDVCSKKIGYLNNETGEIQFTEITEDHIKYAKQHLFNTGKYFCSNNMEAVFRQFANGDLSFEEVEKESIVNTDLQQLNLETEGLGKEARDIKSIEELIDKRENNGLGENGG